MTDDLAATFHRTLSKHLAARCDGIARALAVIVFHNRSKTMPKFTVETTYRLPYYRHATYDAVTPAEACRLAIEDDDWSGELPDHECVGPTYVTGIWRGASSAYEGEDVAVPSHFDETVQRKADHFPALLDQLAFVAQPMGISTVDFARWLPKAAAAVEKARAIIEERRDPDEPNR